MPVEHLIGQEPIGTVASALKIFLTGSIFILEQFFLEQEIVLNVKPRPKISFRRAGVSSIIC